MALQVTSGFFRNFSHTRLSVTSTWTISTCDLDVDIYTECQVSIFRCSLGALTSSKTYFSTSAWYIEETLKMALTSFSQVQAKGEYERDQLICCFFLFFFYHKLLFTFTTESKFSFLKPHFPRERGGKSQVSF